MERKKKMNYIYDILLNFTDDNRLIEFYEWSESDYFEHIKRIPVYRVSSKVMKDICQNKIKVSKEFIEKIQNKTDLYKKKKNIKYATLLSDINKAIALEFSDDGIVISKSSLLIDEEESVIDECLNINESNLEYIIIEPYKTNYFLTRKELFKQNYLLKELDYILKVKDIDKLTYLYEEIFKTDKLKFEEKLKRLINDIKNNYNNKHNELYNIVRLTYIKK